MFISVMSGNSSFISINLSAWIFSTSLGGTGAYADASLNCGLAVTTVAVMGMPSDGVVDMVLGAESALVAAVVLCWAGSTGGVDIRGTKAIELAGGRWPGGGGIIDLRGQRLC